MIRNIIKDDRVHFFVDYDPEFVVRAKKGSGIWNSFEKSWSFSLKNYEEVKQILREIYGEEGEGLT
ncbi:hypothetical protein FH589_01935 (plasmid) [Leptospira interrogans]|uniref:hypothetical protein n=1 Tax=Leptospira interrogans TaxID=173 RepID=UPI001EF096C7|nr:hypothetical protein [Leptospira interrogans]ULG82564.1 hypothetical protein FH595_19545 [Leptospira interrogans]UML67440.1 hypothetical protein FH589_01935 [Leptospira interrogans]UML82824.1 hypothetical protein FH587_02760 [Leptospira interrogans]